jgi:hypothetical protein
MVDFQTFRDAGASLWQSAVAAALAQTPDGATPAVAQAFAKQAERGATLLSHLKALAGLGMALPQGAALSLAAMTPDPQAALALAADAEALRFANPTAFAESLRLQFGLADPRWLLVLRTFHEFKRRGGKVPYRTHATLEDFVLERLPARATVALLADWGTGTPEAVEVLRQVAGHRPDVLIHLGDIYYSGQEEEVEGRFRRPLRQVFGEDVLTRRQPLILTLFGNHDMYGGGQAYFGLLDQLGQPASYFCLRNDDWQLVAMDTGKNSGIADPFRHLQEQPTHLEPTEVDWLRHRVKTAGRRKTVLLSHHQLFSTFEKIGEGSVNPNLESLTAFLPPDTVWYWGHEHDLIVFKPHRGVRGRCIGHGAIPVLFPPEGLPRRRIDDNAIPVDDSVRLGRNGAFYNNGYVLLEFDGPNASETFFQVPAGQQSPARLSL